MDRNVSAQLEVTFIVRVLEAASDEVGHREPGIVRVLIGILHPAAVDVSADGSEELGAAGLGDQLDDTAAHVAVLRLKPARLDLNFLHEGEVDTGSERAVDAGPHADSTEGRIVNGNAIGDVQVFKTGGTGDRGVFRSCCKTRGYARREIEQAADAATQGNLGIEAVRKIGVHRDRARVHGHCGSVNLNGLRHFTGFQDNFNTGRLVNQNFGGRDAGDLEAGLLDFNRIESGNQG